MSARWDRLDATLAAAGISAKVDRSVWCNQITERISIRADGGWVCVRDTWWRDHWTGWQVEASGADSITIRLFPKTKKRSDVRDHVAAALAALAV